MVYKVKRASDGAEYALKKIKLMDLKDKEKENALNEIRLLASIRHANIIGYKEAFFEKKINVLWYRSLHQASSWSTQTMGISSKKSVSTRRKRCSWRRKGSGSTPSR